MNMRYLNFVCILRFNIIFFNFGLNTIKRYVHYKYTDTHEFFDEQFWRQAR